MADCDTPDKRRSAANMFLFVINPVADGSIDAQDREIATGIYGGISATVTEAKGNLNFLWTIFKEEGWL